jgi:hypothetical protein
MLKEPGEHGWQTLIELAPVAIEKVPAAHGTHFELIGNML